MECGLGVPRGLEDHLMAHIKYTDGFPDQQTINLTYWKPGCTKSLTNVQFTQGWELLEWVQEHIPAAEAKATPPRKRVSTPKRVRA